MAYGIFRRPPPLPPPSQSPFATLTAKVESIGWSWYQQFGIPAFSRFRDPQDAFVRSVRDSTEFTTPTPAEIGWFTPWQPPEFTRRALPDNSFVSKTPFIQTLTTSIGWYEAWDPPKPALVRVLPDSATVSRTPFIQTLTTDFDWYTQWGKPAPTKVKPAAMDALARAPSDFSAAPAFGWYTDWDKPRFTKRGDPDNSLSWTPPNFTAVTPGPTGWYVAWGKPPPAPPKGPASSVAWDPQATFVQPTLTTDIGWYAPWLPPEFTRRRRSESLVAQTPPNFTAATPSELGWFTPWGTPVFTRRQLPQDAQARAPSSFFVATPFDLGWFDTWEPPAFTKRSLPDNSLVSKTPFIQTLTTDFDWYTAFGIPAPTKVKPITDALAFAPRDILVPPFGWFLAWQPPSFTKRRQPESLVAQTPPNFTAATPNTLEWFEPFGLPQFTKRGMPDNSLVLGRATPVTLTTDIGWYNPWEPELTSIRPPKKPVTDAFALTYQDVTTNTPANLEWYTQYVTPFFRVKPPIINPAFRINRVPTADPPPPQFSWYAQWGKPNFTKRRQPETLVARAPLRQIIPISTDGAILLTTL